MINIIKGWYYRVFKKNEDLYNKRIEICNKCDNKIKLSDSFNICNLCGCELSAKCRVKDEKCLMKKW